MIALRCGLALAVVGCAEPDIPGEFDGLRLDAELDFANLDGRVQIARDTYGIAHIAATTAHDAGFAQGYVTAHDRFVQMDLARRFATGRLAELYGTDDAVIDTDIEMRFYRLGALARATREAMPRADAPRDPDVVALVDGYAEGVNAYADDVLAGKWSFDPVVDAALVRHVERFASDADRWSAADSLAILRLYTFGASWTVPTELAFAEIYDDLRSGPRAALAEDLARFQPIAGAPTIIGFPPSGQPDGPPVTATRLRPVIAAATYADARALFRRDAATGPEGRLGPHAMIQPNVSGTSFAIGPTRTSSPELAGPALLASTHNARLGNPSQFYPTHVVVGAVDVAGVTLPGVPGVLYGTNGTIAWTGTPGRHDVNDLYRVDTSSNFSDDVLIDGTRFDLEFEIEGTRPVLPRYDRSSHTIKGHTDGEDRLAVEYPGFAGATFELAALWSLANAPTIEAARDAIAGIAHGDQSWMLIDAGRSIAWATAPLPQRPQNAMTWDATTRPGDTAPMFPLDGTVSALDWIGGLPADSLPGARDPAAGYLVTSGADPVGALVDNDPLNGPVVGDTRLYTGAAYAAGLQQERVATLIETGGLVTANTATAIQLDTRSNAGAVLRDRVVAALDTVLDRTRTTAAPGTTIDRRRVELARDLLAGWSLAAPTTGSDAAATALFDAWLAAFARRLLCDEPTPLLSTCAQGALPADTLLRLVHVVLVEPETVVARTPEGPLLCDDATTPAVESCGLLAVLAALDAIDELVARTGSASPSAWQWGALHQLVLEPAFPTGDPTRLRLPEDGGFPQPGDQFSILTADRYGGAFALGRPDGAALRMLAVAPVEGPIELRLQLPGGTIFDARDPHYRDLLDRYLRGEYFVVPYSTAQIIDAGEYRWEFR